MEDKSEEWKIEEHSSSKSEESKMAWILDNGLNIGKKIVITGVVISSTPLILPPLIVISALGFALSVPFGILLSSYACTEKLMSKLLPRPDYPLILEGGTIDEKEDLWYEYSGKGIEINEYQDLTEKGDGSGYEEDVGEYLDIEQPSDHVNVEEKDVRDENEGAEERASDKKLEKTRKDDIQETESQKKEDDEKNTDVNVVGEKTVIDGSGTDKKSAKRRKGDNKQDTSEKEKVVPQTKEEQIQLADKTPEDSVALKSSEEKPESKRTAAIHSGKGVGLTEEKIWERLDALRAIVGYKASSHGTYIGELRALYMFAGVEPPTPFMDPSDLVEVSDKLGFLMSIIGVK